ncbi:hypothetical protein HanRHA438_Chr12g0552321 [Helianthus annuus]|nr:hypothetical protein HanRHA438_Chr12g0552321 [Helianthus annuus]
MYTLLLVLYTSRLNNVMTYVASSLTSKSQIVSAMLLLVCNFKFDLKKSNMLSLF